MRVGSQGYTVSDLAAGIFHPAPAGSQFPHTRTLFNTIAELGVDRFTSIS
jgi:hypothetical protein